MDKYRKKPVTVEAVQFDGLNPTEIKDFVGENCEVEIYDNEVTPPVARIVIHTLEGDMKVSKGDYVIKGVNGEFYPCKPDIFEQSYESAETQKSLEEAAKAYQQQIIEETKNHIHLPQHTYAEGFEDALHLISDAFMAGWEYRGECEESSIMGDLLKTILRVGAQHNFGFGPDLKQLKDNEDESK